MDKKFCFDALAEEGFQPEIDEDGDISFLAGEVSLSLLLDEEDKDFFSLVCAFEVDDMDQLELFYSAASEASRQYRIAKAYIGEIEDECFEIRFSAAATCAAMWSCCWTCRKASLTPAEKTTRRSRPSAVSAPSGRGPRPLPSPFMLPCKKTLAFFGHQDYKTVLDLANKVG